MKQGRGLRNARDRLPWRGARGRWHSLDQPPSRCGQRDQQGAVLSPSSEIGAGISRGSICQAIKPPLVSPTARKPALLKQKPFTRSPRSMTPRTFLGSTKLTQPSSGTSYSVCIRPIASRSMSEASGPASSLRNIETTQAPDQACLTNSALGNERPKTALLFFAINTRQEPGGMNCGEPGLTRL